MSDALVLTHPFKRFNADETEIETFLNKHNGYDKIYYVGKNDGRKPLPVENISEPDENRQSRLPPAFTEGHYERGLEETEWGELTDEEAHKLLEEHEKVDVAGAQLGRCVKNTFQSLLDKRAKHEEYSLTELDINYKVAYGVV